MLSILKYIIKSNNLFGIGKYLILAIVFQVFKRLTHSIISKNIFNGKKIFMYPQCNVSSMFAYTDIPDKKEITILRNLIHNNEKVIFFDIGANVGSYSISLMDICNDIIAFEPHPYTSRRCKMNFILNGFSENNVKQLALSDSEGKIHFSDYGESSTINHIVNDGGIEVEAITLDNFVKNNNYQYDRQYAVKIDVEGLEKQVLAGGEYFFTHFDVKGIVFECFLKDEVFKILKNYG